MRNTMVFHSLIIRNWLRNTFFIKPLLVVPDYYIQAALFFQVICLLLFYVMNHIQAFIPVFYHMLFKSPRYRRKQQLAFLNPHFAGMKRKCAFLRTSANRNLPIASHFVPIPLFFSYPHRLRGPDKVLPPVPYTGTDAYLAHTASV